MHLLPALPSALPKGKITGLRARGGLEVDIEWRAGKLVRAVLRAQQAKAVRVRYAGRERDVTATPTTEATPLRREIEDRVLQEWAELATAWGVSPVLGRIHGLLLLNGQPMTIIGVSAPGFRGIEIGDATQVFVPMMMQRQMSPLMGESSNLENRIPRTDLDRVATDDIHLHGWIDPAKDFDGRFGTGNDRLFAANDPGGGA